MEWKKVKNYGKESISGIIKVVEGYMLLFFEKNGRVGYDSSR